MPRPRKKPAAGSIPPGPLDPGDPHGPEMPPVLPAAVLELLNDGLRAGILLLGPDGSIRCSNQHARKLLEIPDPGESGGDLEEGNRLARMIARRIPPNSESGGREGRRQFFQMDSAGDRFLAVTHFPLSSGGGRGQRVVFLEDLSEIIRKGREASTWNRHLVHDLRSPLSSVTGAVDLIFSGRLGDVDPKVLGFLKILRKGADRLVEMLAEASQNRPPGTPPTEKVEEAGPEEVV